MIYSLNEVQIQVNKDIAQHSRGSYDILVRTNGATTNIEKEKGIVHENYLGFGRGGISIEEWEKIKEHPLVEIAAPIASLGYFTGVVSNIGIEPPSNIQSTRNRIQYFTSDGVNKYNIGNEYLCILIESPKLLKYQRDFNHTYEYLLNNPELLNHCNNYAAGAMMPVSYDLLVGIDPEQESKLTGIPYSFTDKGWGNTAKEDLEEFELNLDTIPIIELNQAGVSLHAKISIDNLPITTKETLLLREELNLGNTEESRAFEFIHSYYEPEYIKLLQKLENTIPEETITFEIDLGNTLKSFYQKPVYIKRDGALLNIDETNASLLDSTIDLNSATTYYLASPINYEITAEGININKVGEKNGIPIYRELIEKGAVLTPELVENKENHLRDQVEFIVDPIGTLNISDYQETIASSPLGIYQSAPVHFKKDDSDDFLLMKPTFTPGSFVTSPAKGVTTLEASTAIKGDKPIDAIRIKVIGEENYTPLIQKRIEDVASYLKELGLNVNVVAGSSLQKLEVNVEGIGTVEESWTTLGAAENISKHWSMSSILISVLFFLVSIVYIFNRVYYRLINFNKDITLLNQLGWNLKHTQSLFTVEMLMINSVALLLAFFLAFLFKQYHELNLTNIYLRQVYAATLTSLLVIFVWKLKGNSTGILSQNIKKYILKNSKSMITFRNIMYYSLYIRSSFLQLLIVSCLTTFVYLTLSETVNQLSLTILGIFINTQTSGLLIIVSIAAYTLALFTFWDSIHSQLLIRGKEISTLYIIGWDSRRIIVMLIREITIWSGIAIALGSVISALLFTLIYGIGNNVIYVPLISIFCFQFFVILITFLLLSRKKV